MDFHEDLNSQARRKYQQEQLREWSLQQQHEKNLTRMQQNKSKFEASKEIKKI